MREFSLAEESATSHAVMRRWNARNPAIFLFEIVVIFFWVFFWFFWFFFFGFLSHRDAASVIQSPLNGLFGRVESLRSSFVFIFCFFFCFFFITGVGRNSVAQLELAFFFSFFFFFLLDPSLFTRNRLFFCFFYSISLRIELQFFCYVVALFRLFFCVPKFPKRNDDLMERWSNFVITTISRELKYLSSLDFPNRHRRNEKFRSIDRIDCMYQTVIKSISNPCNWTKKNRAPNKIWKTKTKQ